MRKIKLVSGLSILVVLSLLIACGPSTPPASTTGGALPPVKIGVLRPFTGIAVTAGTELAHGAEFAAYEVGYEVAGRTIVISQADEYQTPEVAVPAAKRFVEDEKVDVLIGPLFSHDSVAVAAYAEKVGKVHISFGPPDEATSNWSFFTFGSGRGLAYPGGDYVYDVMGARTASMLYADYLFGEQNRDGFTAEFTKKGGKMLYTAAVPLGVQDYAPYFAGIGNPDVLVVMAVGPDGATFSKQYKQYGLKVPVFFTSPTLESEDDLNVAADAALGIYGTNTYSPNIDTPANNDFVVKYKAKFGRYPDQPTMWGYWAMRSYLEALKATGGDTSTDKITSALLALNIETPAGPLSFTSGRVALHQVYIFQVIKKDRYTWGVVRQYPAPPPVGPPNK